MAEPHECSPHAPREDSGGVKRAQVVKWRRWPWPRGCRRRFLHAEREGYHLMFLALTVLAGRALVLTGLAAHLLNALILG